MKYFEYLLTHLLEFENSTFNDPLACKNNANMMVRKLEVF